MKNSFFIFLLAALLTSPVLAGECKNGTIFKANNGNVYCKSNELMNWNGASVWCAEQKMALVSWEELCPGSYFAKNCGNLKGTGENSVWTSTKYDGNRAFRINLSCGCTDRNTFPKKHYAICK